MPAPSWAAILTAITTVIVAVGGVLTVLTVLIPILRGTREVHKIVNQQQTDLRNYQAALIRALTDKGIAVPIDQSAAGPEPSSARPTVPPRHAR